MTIRQVKVWMPNGDGLDIELDSAMTCFQAAHAIARERGMPMFEQPWCIGLGHKDTEQGPQLMWLAGERLVEDIPETGCFLSQIPWTVIKWN